MEGRGLTGIRVDREVLDQADLSARMPLTEIRFWLMEPALLEVMAAAVAGVARPAAVVAAVVVAVAAAEEEEPAFRNTTRAIEAVRVAMAVRAAMVARAVRAVLAVLAVLAVAPSHFWRRGSCVSLGVSTCPAGLVDRVPAAAADRLASVRALPRFGAAA